MTIIKITLGTKPVCDNIIKLNIQLYQMKIKRVILDDTAVDECLKEHLCHDAQKIMSGSIQ